MPATAPPRNGGGRLVIRRAATGAALATRAALALSWRQRAVGLLAHRSLPAGDGMVFPRCRAIHTFGMRFPIDTVFVDRHWVVVGLQERVAPGRLVWPVWRAWGVIELPAGTIRESRVQLNDRLEARPAENA
jgi:hypothetical protein